MKFLLDTNRIRYYICVGILITDRGRGAARRWAAQTGGKNVLPLRRAAVERREAPHPYVTGVRAPSHSARAVSQAPQGCLASTPFSKKINYIAAKPSDFGPNELNGLGSVCKTCAARARSRLHRRCVSSQSSR